jgi:hypothetical protein
MLTLVNIDSLETTTVDTTLKVRMKGNRWEGYICLPELPTFLDQLEMYGSSDEEEHNNTEQVDDDDDGKYTKPEGCYHMEMVDKENVKELVGKPPPRRSAREKEKKKPDKEEKKPDPMSDVTNKPGKSSKKKKDNVSRVNIGYAANETNKIQKGRRHSIFGKTKQETKSFDWR